VRCNRAIEQGDRDGIGTVQVRRRTTDRHRGAGLQIQKEGNGRCAAMNERIWVRYCCCLFQSAAQVRACAGRPVEQPPCSLAFASPHRSPIAVPHSLFTASSQWTLQNTRKLCTSAAQNCAWHAGFTRAVARVIRSKTVARPRLTLRHRRTTHASSTLPRP
jgi:hypothetical protein